MRIHHFEAARRVGRSILLGFFVDGIAIAGLSQVLVVVNAFVDDPPILVDNLELIPVNYAEGFLANRVFAHKDQRVPLVTAVALQVIVRLHWAADVVFGGDQRARRFVFQLYGLHKHTHTWIDQDWVDSVKEVGVIG